MHGALTVPQEGVGEVEAPHHAGERVVGRAGLDPPLHRGHLHLGGARLLGQLRVGLLHLARWGGGAGERGSGAPTPHTHTHTHTGRCVWGGERGGEEPAPLCAHLAGGAAGVEPLLARHPALADAAEGLPQGLLQGLDAGQGPLHGQRVVGVQRTPAAPLLSARTPPRGPQPRASPSPTPSHPATWPAPGCAGGNRRARSRGWCRKPPGSTRSAR